MSLSCGRINIAYFIRCEQRSWQRPLHFGTFLHFNFGTLSALCENQIHVVNGLTYILLILFVNCNCITFSCNICTYYERWSINFNSTEVCYSQLSNFPFSSRYLINSLMNRILSQPLNINFKTPSLLGSRIFGEKIFLLDTKRKTMLPLAIMKRVLLLCNYFSY